MDIYMELKKSAFCAIFIDFVEFVNINTDKKRAIREHNLYIIEDKKGEP